MVPYGRFMKLSKSPFAPSGIKLIYEIGFFPYMICEFAKRTTNNDAPLILGKIVSKFGYS
jgi:hypothetical protein